MEASPSELSIVTAIVQKSLAWWGNRDSWKSYTTALQTVAAGLVNIALFSIYAATYKGCEIKNQSFQKLKLAFEWEQFVLGGCPHGDTKLKKDNLLVQAIPIQKPLSIFEIRGGGSPTPYD